eukprot:scaffold34602_cov72-Phaeocystis_antarctica.AAC.2
MLACVCVVLAAAQCCHQAQARRRARRPGEQDRFQHSRALRAPNLIRTTQSATAVSALRAPGKSNACAHVLEVGL